MKPPANRRILLIDDTPAIHEDFRKILAPGGPVPDLDEDEAALFGDGKEAAAAGFDLDSAYQGQEAVAMVAAAMEKDSPYAMALVDMRMPPGWDGVETIERIWRLDPLIQIVVCTAYSDYAWSDILARLDVGDRLLILKKPFDPIEVRQVANALTAKWEMTRQAALKMAELEAANRRLAEANLELQVREARIRRLVESNIIGIFFWELDGGIFEANDAFLAMVGYGSDDVGGEALRWTRLTPPEYVAGDQRAVAEVAATGRCQPFEKQFIRRDGSRVPVLVGGALLEGSQSQGVAFVLDLSERKQAEADRQARLAAEAASRAKSDFLSAMSHELRTPLNAILGYAQMLRRDPGLDERQAGGIDTIEKSGQHLLTLINDLLDLAKIEAGKFDLDPDAMNLATFLPVVADIIRIKAGEKGLLHTLEMPADIPRWVRADEKRLRQVLINLLGNAVKFTDRGRVSLGVRVLAQDGAAASLRFEVADTGIGMAPDQLETIFQPFEQVGDVRRRAGGTGLGLAISRQLVRLMGSTIEVESRPGQGSRFWFDVILPLAEANSAAASAARPPTGYAGAHRKLLVADDVAGNRALLVDLLGGLGFALSEAANGQEAVEQARRERPDLVLMDLVMPEMDGVEAIRRIRGIPGLEGLPIIAVSASADGAESETAIAAGADAFQPKPIDQGRLLECIGRLLGLTWSESDPFPARGAGNGAPLAIPPKEEMAILHQQALTGNMRVIRQQAAHLIDLDERYRPFAEMLRRLAQGYQSKAILSLIELHLHGGART